MKSKNFGVMIMLSATMMIACTATTPSPVAKPSNLKPSSASTPSVSLAQILSGRRSCSEMISGNLRLDNVYITRAEQISNDTNTQSLPAYCLIQGRVNPRIGVDNKTYAISFEMRLPMAWNGRFLHQVNGGNDGAVVPAVGGGNATGNISAISRGFAVLSSDSGHNGNDPVNQPLGLVGGNVFGLDPQARADYGYAANPIMADLGKTLIAAYYGSGPAYSYMMGCSNGGRHSMVTASRFPDLYDGIVAGNPGFNLPKAAVQHAWDVQSLITVNPDLRKAFSPDDMKLVGNKVTEVCDASDGLADGVVGDLKGCQSKFKLSSLQCTGDKNATCLSEAQVKALDRMMAGPKNSKGEQLYSDWPYDASLGLGNWRGWKLESTDAFGENFPRIATLGGGSLAYIFTTPPTLSAGKPADLVSFLSKFNFDSDAAKIFAKDATFKESAIEFMTPLDTDNPSLAKFKAAKRKLIVYHGASDPVFSVNDSINWYEKLNKNNGGDATDFARLFVVPGMTHCNSGAATDQFDALSAITNWVEAGRTPDRIIATVNPASPDLPATWSKTRTRPLCIWPKIAKYTGGEKGDKEIAASFTCE